MKLINNITDIFNKNKFDYIELPKEYNNIYTYLNDYPEKRGDYESDMDDIYFLEKYKLNIAPGHYGFAIGTPIIPKWLEIIDNILTICINSDSNFEIAQIKTKYGRICFYVYSEIIEDLLEIEELVSKFLYDRYLIY